MQLKTRYYGYFVRVCSLMGQSPDAMAYEIGAMRTGEALEAGPYRLRLEGRRQSPCGTLYRVMLTEDGRPVLRAPLLISPPKRS